MPKQLLLVDDEKFFLDGIKEGLAEFKDIFTTDICFSVTYGGAEVLAGIKRLGGVEILLKPFNLDWFKEKITDFFSDEEGVSGTIEAISLTSLLQFDQPGEKTPPGQGSG